MNNYDVAGILTTYAQHARYAKKYRAIKRCCPQAQRRIRFKKNKN